jgi:hypothetical protein
MTLLLALSLAAAAHDDTPVEAAPARPTATMIFTSGALQGAERSERWRERRVEALDRQLDSTPSDATAAALLEERADLHQLLAREAYMAAMSEWDADPTGGDPDLGAARTAWQDAATDYTEALPLLDGTDAARVALRLVTTLESLEAPTGPLLEQALQADPHGPHADELHIRLGDQAFETGELPLAAEHYAAVQPGLHAPYATYKGAWVAFNLGDLEAALAALASLGSTELEHLRTEAGRDLARIGAHADLDATLAAIDRFCAGDAACTGDLTTRLADGLARQGRTAEAQQLR